MKPTPTHTLTQSSPPSSTSSSVPSSPTHNHPSPFPPPLQPSTSPLSHSRTDATPTTTTTTPTPTTPEDVVATTLAHKPEIDPSSHQQQQQQHELYPPLPPQEQHHLQQQQQQHLVSHHRQCFRSSPLPFKKYVRVVRMLVVALAFVGLILDAITVSFQINVMNMEFKQIASHAALLLCPDILALIIFLALVLYPIRFCFSRPYPNDVDDYELENEYRLTHLNQSKHSSHNIRRSNHSNSNNNSNSNINSSNNSNIPLEDQFERQQHRRRRRNADRLSLGQDSEHDLENRRRSRTRSVSHNTSSSSDLTPSIDPDRASRRSATRRQGKQQAIVEEHGYDDNDNAVSTLHSPRPSPSRPQSSLFVQQQDQDQSQIHLEQHNEHDEHNHFTTPMSIPPNVNDISIAQDLIVPTITITMAKTPSPPPPPPSPPRSLTPPRPTSPPKSRRPQSQRTSTKPRSSTSSRRSSPAVSVKSKSSSSSRKTQSRTSTSAKSVVPVSTIASAADQQYTHEQLDQMARSTKRRKTRHFYAFVSVRILLGLGLAALAIYWPASGRKPPLPDYYPKGGPGSDSRLHQLNPGWGDIGAGAAGTLNGRPPPVSPVSPILSPSPLSIVSITTPSSSPTPTRTPTSSPSSSPVVSSAAYLSIVSNVLPTVDSEKEEVLSAREPVEMDMVHRTSRFHGADNDDEDDEDDSPNNNNRNVTSHWCSFEESFGDDQSANVYCQVKHIRPAMTYFWASLVLVELVLSFLAGDFTKAKKDPVEMDEIKAAEEGRMTTLSDPEKDGPK
ncbi:hypothetical protein BGZ94_006720 [Podila epigama]|nr:hypothetical protein BGZ94_006720 [Podila epigama]